MSTLILEKINKKFGDDRVLRDLSLEIRSGEILGLLGNPGSGKTTLSRIIGGLDAPLTGTIRLDGADITAISPSERGFGLVSQGASLFQDQAIFDNIAFGLREKGLSQDEVVRRTNEMLVHIGLADHGRLKPA